MKTAHRLNNIQEYFFSRKLQEVERMRQAGANIINLGIGSPELPPPPQVIEALSKFAQNPKAHSYQSYRGAVELRTAMSNWYKRWYNVDLNPNTELLPLIGSKEGINHVCMTYLGAGDEALVPNPGYPAYKTAVELACAIPITYRLTEKNNWLPDLEALAKRDLSSVKLMWVNYPNMPTGKGADMKLFEKLIAFGKKHNILICHDNPYSFILNDKPQSLLSVDGAKDTAIELNSLSKAYHMAGWRIGMLAGAADVVNDVLKYKSNLDSGMFLPAQLAAAVALETPATWHEEQNTIYLKRRKTAEQLLTQLGATFDPAQSGMFVWARIPAGYANGVELCDALLQQQHIFVTPGSVFGSEGDKYFRLSLCCTAEQMEECFERVKKHKTVLV